MGDGCLQSHKPIYFLLIARALWTGKIKSIRLADDLTSTEFILHSILAVIFTGFALGFQYILFTLAIPIVVLSNDKNYLRYNSIRTFISIGVYGSAKGIYMIALFF